MSGARGQARELLERYVLALDRRDDDAWLALFAADGYYAVLRRAEYEAGNNVVLVGEDVKRLAARIEGGRTADLRRMVHLLGALRTEDLRCEATFALWYDGSPAYAGSYVIELVEAPPDRLFIRRCTVVLDNPVLAAPIYRPI